MNAANLAKEFLFPTLHAAQSLQAVTICPDHAATSSSRNVRSADWNVARSKMEHLPAAIAHREKSLPAQTAKIIEGAML